MILAESQSASSSSHPKSKTMPLGNLTPMIILKLYKALLLVIKFLEEDFLSDQIERRSWRD